MVDAVTGPTMTLPPDRPEGLPLPSSPRSPDESDASGAPLGTVRRWLAGVICPELRRDAERDPLTGLNNWGRDALILSEEVDRWNAEPESRLVRFRIDLDNFKAFNETFGHRTGDRILHLVARVIEGSTRAEEEVLSPARVGGDEFALTLRVPRGTDVVRIRDRLERRIREALQREGLSDRRGVTFGASVGFAEARPGMDAGELDEQADRMAQDRKRARGRSRSAGSHPAVRMERRVPAPD